MNVSNEAAKRLAVMNYLIEGSDVGYNDGWRTASEIQNATGVTPAELRAICSDYPQTFLGSNRGYKLVRMSSMEEVNDCLRTLLSRSEKIMHRARSLQRYALERSKVELRAKRVA